MSDIAKAIRQIASTGDEVYSIVGTVISVDAGARTCEVEPRNGDAILYNVRLQSVLDGGEGVVLTPVVGSDVIVTFLNAWTGYVAIASELESVGVKVGDKEATLTDQGLSYKSATADLAEQVGALMDELSGLMDTLLALQVNTPSGPSTGATGTSVAQINAHKASFSTVKAQLENLIK